MTIDESDIDTVLNAYLDCAVWVSHPLTEDAAPDASLADLGHTRRSCCDATVQQAREDITAFLTENADHLAQVLDDSYLFSDVGHDFFLSRNGHGAGFLDRRGSVFAALQKSAKGYGPTEQVRTHDNGTVTILP
jgi:hypothetical protein